MSPVVVHLVSSLQMGGAERFVVDLLGVQRDDGLRPRVVSFGADRDALVGSARATGATVVCLRGLPRAAQLRRLYEALHDAQVLHVHSPWALRPLLPLLPVLRGKLVYTRHGAHPYGAWRWRLLHRFARAFGHALTFVNTDGERVFLKTHGAWRQPSQIIENGANLDVPLTRPVADDGRLRLGSVGRLVELKGQAHLLRALGGLSPDERAGFSVQLFGEGPEEAALRRLARDIPDVPVVFHGLELDRERIYAQIDVLVVTSRLEGLSLAIMEAMARRIPVLATEVGGNGRLVLPDQTGLLMPYGDEPALREALRRVGQRPDLVAQLGAGARAHVEAHYALAGTAAAYRRLYGV